MKSKSFLIVRSKNARGFWVDLYAVDKSAYRISGLAYQSLNNLTGIKLKLGEQKKFRIVEVKGVK